MSVYANALTAPRFPGFTLPRRSISQELKAVLAGGAVWAVLLVVISFQDVPDTLDMQSNTNLSALQIEPPEADQVVPLRQHY